MISCLLLGIQEIHSKGVILNDIKPENVALDEQGYPYLIDFGSSEYLQLNN